MRIGTSYFVSRSHAEHYYHGQGYGETMSETAVIVNEKLNAGDIHFGKPPMKAGDKLLIVDDGDRYAIEEA